MRIGRVSISEKHKSTTDEFHFWLDNDQIVDTFDIIKVPHLKNSHTYALIRDLTYITDSPGHMGNFVSYDFGDTDAEPITERLGVTYATAQVLSNNKEIYMPVRDGNSVQFANADEIKIALGLDNVKQEIPAGFISMSNNTSVPVCFDADFLIGPEGAHLNISGISGLATKTSYAMFLLQAIQQKQKDTAIIILNVKGRDLLRINESAEDTDGREDWEKCGLEFKPFDNVKFFYPFDKNPDRSYSRTHLPSNILKQQHESGKAANYVYTYKEHRDKIELLFSNVEDTNQTLDSILVKISEDSEFNVPDWKKFLDKVSEYTQASSGKDKEITINSWRRFKRLLNSSIKPYLGNSLFQNSKSTDPKHGHCFLSEEIQNIKSGDVFVVDIAALEEQLQCLVFGDIVDAVYQLKNEGRDSDEPVPSKIIIFVDELNKYAPAATKSTPILNLLLEIAERGRSMGIILFSAQQFKSAVHSRITGNSGTHVFGRTNSIEVAKKDYNFISDTFKSMMTRLNKGELIIQHPIFRTLLKIKFPKPSYFQSKE
ncbi:ATP-binding protein [Brevibacillus sp. FSL K6-2834]|uniref:ATP-binding protein n=1 Tax=Brevibacillus sp. FSL K6-2834 TaxID=2954680 RepID=UPI00315910F3